MLTVMACNSRRLYWECNKCNFVFMTANGKIPYRCPCCGNNHYVHGITDKDFDLLRHNLSRSFKHYQYMNDDYAPGSYGRFIARYFNLPDPPVDSPLDIDDLIRRHGIVAD